MHLELIKYSLATYLDGIGFEHQAEMVTDLDRLFAASGDCDNDVILRIRKDSEVPIYRWCKEKSQWSVIQ